MTGEKKLYRSDDARLGGVCAGIAEYFGIDPTVVRVIAVIATVLTSGIGLLIYIVLMVVLPKKPADFTQPVDVTPLETPSASRPTGVGPDGRPVGAPVPPAGAETYAAYNANTASIPTQPFNQAPGNAEAPFTAAQPTASSSDTAPFTAQASGPGAQPGTPPASSASNGSAPGAGYATTYGAAYDAPVKEKNGDPWYLWPLIIIGLIFVGAGLSSFISRFVPGVSWWNFWPLIIIVCGFISIFTKGGKEKWHVERLFSGLSTIVIGCIILGCTTGVLGWGIIFSIISLWPAFLVCLGLVIVGAATHMRFFNCLASVVFIAALVFASTNVYASVNQDGALIANKGFVSTDSGALARSVDLTDYQTASLEYSTGGSVCTIESGRTDGVTVYSGNSYMGTNDISLEQSREGALVKVSSGLYDSTQSNATLLSPRVHWDTITIKAGASSLNLDAGDLNISTLHVEAGMADVVIALGQPAASSSTLELNAGMAGNTVTIPRGTPAAIEVQSGFSSTDFNGFTYDVSSGKWVTEGYAAAKRAGEPCWNIDVRGGLGSFNIDAA